jgi:hypothetical protein
MLGGIDGRAIFQSMIDGAFAMQAQLPR